jgi:hypothetical protein
VTDAANPSGAESLDESSAEAALTAAFTDQPAAPKQQAPEVPEEVEAPEDTGDELTPEDIEDEPPPKDDAAEFEIVVAGQTHSVYKRWSS